MDMVVYNLPTYERKMNILNIQTRSFVTTEPFINYICVEHNSGPVSEHWDFSVKRPAFYYIRIIRINICIYNAGWS